MKFLGVDFSAHRPPRPADLVRLVEATNIAGRSLNALLELITSGKLRVYQHETERWSMVSRADLEKLLAGSKEPR